MDTHSNMGFAPGAIAAGASAAPGIIESIGSIFGGGGGPNIAKTFSRQVGIGKTYLQSEADQIKATASQYGLDPVKIARAENELRRKLTTNELRILAGMGPVGSTPATQASSGYGQALQVKQQQAATAEKTSKLVKLIPWGAAAFFALKYL